MGKKKAASGAASRERKEGAGHPFLRGQCHVRVQRGSCHLLRRSSAGGRGEGKKEKPSSLRCVYAFPERGPPTPPSAVRGEGREKKGFWDGFPLECGAISEKRKRKKKKRPSALHYRLPCRLLRKGSSPRGTLRFPLSAQEGVGKERKRKRPPRFSKLSVLCAPHHAKGKKERRKDEQRPHPDLAHILPQRGTGWARPRPRLRGTGQRGREEEKGKGHPEAGRDGLHGGPPKAPASLSTVLLRLTAEREIEREKREKKLPAPKLATRHPEWALCGLQRQGLPRICVGHRLRRGRKKGKKGEMAGYREAPICAVLETLALFIPSSGSPQEKKREGGEKSALFMVI